MNSQGIQIFLPDGRPNGLKIIVVSGWSGKAFVIPRADLKQMRQQEENSFPAIYYLIGEGDEPSRQKVYIGESENNLQRLSNHDDNKDFWNTAIVFTSGLDKADVKYLENKSVTLAKSINRYEIVNTGGSIENKLSSFKKSAADNYFEKMKFVLALFGYALFQEVPKLQSSAEIFYCKGENFEGKGTLLETGEFVVYKDSLARMEETPSYGKGNVAFRRELVSEGILIRENDKQYIL